MVGRMDVPGRWAGGFRAWDEHGVYLATGRGVPTGRVLRVPADGAARAVRRLVPVRRAPHRGAVRHRAQHRVDGAAARVAGHPRHAGRRPRPRDQQPGRGRHPGGRRARGRVPDAARPRSAASPRTRSRPHQFAALDALRREIEPRAGGAGPAGPRRPGGGAVARGSTGHGVERDWVIAPPLAAAGVDLAWCERAATVLDGPALEPGLEWVASTLVGRQRCSPR